MARIDDLQSRTDALLGRHPTEAGATTAALDGVEAAAAAPFSPFVPDQLEQAVEVARRLTEIAGDRGEEGVEAALAEAERLTGELPPRLVRHAVQLFVVHHGEASRLAIQPAPPPSDAALAPSVAADEEAVSEASLRYLREDPLANDHHLHWHLVYPTQPQDGRLQHRQGELFFYMHRQMLARYDAERLSLGLEPVRPFDDYRQPIEEGHGERPPGQALADVDFRMPDGRPFALPVEGLEAQRDAILDALGRGAFDRPTLIESMSFLGTIVEPEAGTPAPQIWHHGAGHMITAFVMHPDTGESPGEIGDPETAIRDPWFWRWHRHVDDFGLQLEERFAPHSFDDAPPVELRSDDDPSGGDLVLVFDDRMPVDAAADPEAARAWATETFGGERFDAPPDPAASTGELVTAMAQTPMDPSDPGALPVTHLTHRAFSVAVRVRSTGSERHRVTVRLFLAPEQSASDRRAWMELDKFDAWLEPGERAVLCRAIRLSSAVRKPVTAEPQFTQPTSDEPREQYCRCGWPYHLLLPRGSDGGMPFRLAAIVTDFALDHLHGDSHCGSLSFCGAVDEEFPDRREMGYPFNRPFGERSISDTLAAHASMATRTLTIRHEGGP